MSKTANSKLRIIFLSALISLSGCTAGKSSAPSASEGTPVSEETGSVEESSAAEEQGTASAPALELMEDTETDVRGFLKTSQQLVNTADVQIHSLFEIQAKEKKDYTVMIYMVGSNLESRFGAATKDIEEMFSAGVDFSNVNVLLYTGGSRRWNIDLPSDRNCVLDLSAGGDPVIAETSGSADMGAPETLSAFINYCTDLYPAEHYGLICWDHGGGPLFGYGADELYKNDTMLMEEMKNALDNTAFHVKNLDFIGFDACLMGSLETANTLKDYADYMIASQELEAGDGWDYSFLRILNETNDPAVIGKGIVSAFTQYYEAKKSEFSNPDITLSVIDLSKIPALSKEADQFSSAMLDYIDNGGYADICRIRNDIKMYGIINSDSKEEGYDLVDIGDMADRYAELFPDQAAALKNALGEAVTDLGTNVADASGLSLYFPSFNRELLAESKDLRENVFTEEYARFMDGYIQEGSGISDIDWTMDTVQKDGDHYTLHLTDEQYENAAEVFYTVFMSDDYITDYDSETEDEPEEQGYCHITSEHIRIDLKDGQDLRIPLDPQLVVFINGEDRIPTQFEEIEVNKKNTLYKSYKAILEQRDFNDVDHMFTITVKKDNATNELQIENIYVNDDSVGVSGKNNIDIRNYKFIEMVWSGQLPQYDDTSRLLPYNQWENTGTVICAKSYIDDSIAFETDTISSFNDQFSFQVVVKDIYGGYHGSGLFKYDRNEQTQKEYEDIVYTLDQKGWIAADGSEAKGEIVIPDRIDGKPVYAIGDSCFEYNTEITKVTLPESVKVIKSSAFSGMDELQEIELNGTEIIEEYAISNCYNLSTIRFPDSLRFLGTCAAGYCGLESVYIPEGVTEIQTAPFTGNELKEIAVSDNNPNYRSIDGVLFTKDGKTLIEYPAAKGTRYTVPDGTETIGYHAFDSIFMGENLEYVEFPETLKVIDNCAFYGCEQLKELNFPDSLEYIGGYAFGSLFINSAEKGIDTVRIGKNVKYIGDHAFSAQKINEFTVDPENQYFSASGMFILNKSGDTLLQMPCYDGSYIIVPEGVKSLKEDFFNDMSREAEYYLPDSLYRFPAYVFNYADLVDDKPVYDCIIHCNPGSAAEEYAKMFNIRYDYDMELKEAAEN